MNNIKNGQFWLGDCLELMKNIPDGSIDMILCDLPYGTTACKWDTVIPFAPLWEQYNRIAKPKAAIVLTASQPFTTALIMSQIDKFKYCWVWEKSKAGGIFNAKNMPLKKHEDVCIFSSGTTANGSDLKMPYFPQGLQKIDKVLKNKIQKSGGTIGNRPSRLNGEYVQESTGYPTTVLKFNNDKGFHPTQKPVALFEYLIKTYTNEGETVLDNCAGSGTTAIAAENTGRKWICIEQDPAYYYQAVGRVWNHAKPQT